MFIGSQDWYVTLGGSSAWWGYFAGFIVSAMSFVMAVRWLIRNPQARATWGSVAPFSATVAAVFLLFTFLSGALQPVTRDDFDQSVSSGAAAQSWPLLFYKVCDGEQRRVVALGIARSWESLTPLEQRRQQEDTLPSYLANLVPVEKRLPSPNEFSSPPYVIYAYNALEEEEHEFIRRNQALYEAYTRGETQNFWWGVASADYFVQTRQNGKPVFFVIRK